MRQRGFRPFFRWFENESTLMQRTQPTITIGARVSVRVRQVAEVLAKHEGTCLSRWSAEAICQRAVRDLAKDGADRRDLSSNTTLKGESHDEE